MRCKNLAAKFLGGVFVWNMLLAWGVISLLASERCAELFKLGMMPLEVDSR
mgnify:CR=1 FL=1